MKTTIHRDIAWASGRWLAAIAVTVPMLSGCDLFWKPCADPSADCLMAASGMEGREPWSRRCRRTWLLPRPQPGER